MLSPYQNVIHDLLQLHTDYSKIGPNGKLGIMMESAKKLFGGKISIPSIVIAGTKGKGSTCAVAESVLRSSGLNTFMFTSPHLVTARERLRYNGIPISEDEYVQTYYSLRQLLNKFQIEEPPFFAFHTLMVGQFLKTHHVDAAVIECGIGSRFDYTQIFEPTVSVVTHLEFDHESLLGHQPETIAWNKAGVYTKNAIALTVPQSPGFHEALLLNAKKQGAKLQIISPKYSGKMGLHGPSAQENTALGIAAAEALCKVIKISAKSALGAERAFIAGRYQELVHGGIKWLLDGAHTADSVRNCFKWYSNKHTNNDILLCATTKQRNPNVLLKDLLAMKWKEVVYLPKYNHGQYSIPNVTSLNSNIRQAVKYLQSKKPKQVLVTGSLHLVGDTLGELGWKPK